MNSYQQTFYYIAARADHEPDEEIPGSNPVPLDQPQVIELIERAMQSAGNFIGFVDDEGVTLQVAFEPHQNNQEVWIDIPIPKAKGSYGGYFSAAQGRDILLSLQMPFSQYTEKLNLEFSPWAPAD